MNGRSDASTSTDDVKGRPLCLFYFSQPLGVVAAEPPHAAPCPAYLYRPAGFAPYTPSPPPPPPPAHMAPAWDSLWAPAPLSSPSAYVSGSSSPRAPPPRRDTLSSSLFSSEAWFPSSASSRCEYPRRVLPYHAQLPPLRLPTPLVRSLAPGSPDETADVAWPLRVQPERFSLPPIELPRLCEPDGDEGSEPPRAKSVAAWEPAPGQSAAPASSRQSRRATVARRRLRVPPGVHKPRRRARASAVRRSLTYLIQRSIKCSSLPHGGRDGSASSCCVRAALRTLRAAWPPPAPLHKRADTSHACRWRSGSRLSSPCTWCASAPPAPSPPPAPAAATAMPRAPEPAPRAGASPGLLRRRYSVPETIMRKYRLAQQSNDSEEPCAATSPSSSSPVGAPPCGSCGARGAHGDRELMRKSALLRRLWGRAPAPAPQARVSRSLHGSSSELRRSPAGSGWATPKRQRLEWPCPRAASPPPSPGASPACSDCTFASHRAHSPAARSDPARDVFARYSDLAGDAARSSRAASAHSSLESSATLTESPPTTLPAPAAAAPPPVEIDRYTSLPFDVLTAAGSPPYEVLEIVVSETVEAARAPDGSSARGARSPARARVCNINIDEYVSNILVESLNSLSEQLESMSAAVGGAGVVVEKEIKVRLQNTGVNTIVHLSPTSNHQIIFGNEELCHADNEARDACNNPRPPSPPTPPTFEPEPNNNERPDSVNRAVLQQIQKLFHDELYRLEPGPYPGEPTLAHIESSNVDVYLEHHSESHSGSAGSPGAPAGLAGLGIGAGNYWSREPALVPRLSALPHSASMEVNTSSSEAEPSACTSLVDSLDDPASPRTLPPPVRRLARSAVDVLDLLPEAPVAPQRDRPEAFFVRITDENYDCEKENVVVADRMPDRIRERLLRRHRKRELRMESRRCGGIERVRRRAADRDARAVVAALIDELISKIAQEEYKCMRIQRRFDRAPCGQPRNGNRLDEHNGFDSRAIHGKLLPPPATDAPRRIYQKSEIHDGDKCIEILEILEYVDDSQNSPETTNSDERHGNSKSRKSRIPIPIYERIQRTTRRNSDRRRSPPPAPSPSPPSPSPARRASVPPPAEPRARAGSLRFRRVFDIIPEERPAGAGADSPPASDVPALGRRVSAPSLPPPPSPPRTTRSAATSPPAPARSSRGTMTSPRRAAPAAPAPRVAAGSNGNVNERRVATESRKQRRASLKARAGGGGARVPSRAGSPPPCPRSPRRLEPASPQHADAASPRAREPGSPRARSSSSGSSSGSSSLLCAAPRWLAARRRRPRVPRQFRTSRDTHRTQLTDLTGVTGARDGSAGKGNAGGAGGWSVTVAGSCRAALPADVEMRLRFPRDARVPAPPRAPPARATAPPRNDADATPRRSVATRSDETGTTECWCRCCSCGGAGAASGGAPAGPAAPALPPPRERRPSLAFTMRKEDSSTLPRKSRKKCSRTHLPELEPAPAGGGGGGGRRRSGKMRRACSLHCWLPAAAPRRAGGAELAVEGSAIVPELKPRAPTMSERDLTRHHTPRLYLRC